MNTSSGWEERGSCLFTLGPAKTHARGSPSLRPPPTHLVPEGRRRRRGLSLVIRFSRKFDFGRSHVTFSLEPVAQSRRPPYHVRWRHYWLRSEFDKKPLSAVAAVASHARCNQFSSVNCPWLFFFYSFKRRDTKRQGQQQLPLRLMWHGQQYYVIYYSVP